MQHKIAIVNVQVLSDCMLGTAERMGLLRRRTYSLDSLLFRYLRMQAPLPWQS